MSNERSSWLWRDPEEAQRSREGGQEKIKGARVYRAEYQTGKNLPERENSKALQRVTHKYSDY